MAKKKSPPNSNKNSDWGTVKKIEKKENIELINERPDFTSFGTIKKLSVLQVLALVAKSTSVLASGGACTDGDTSACACYACACSACGDGN